MDKRHVADILEQIGLLLELSGENPFKARAFYQAARTVETMSEDLVDAVESGEIGELPGIGPRIQENITQLVRMGRSSDFEELRATVPPGLVDVLRVQGLGPKKVRDLWKQLGITSLGELEAAAREDRLGALAGFGKKTTEKILKGIEQLHKHGERFRYPKALEEATRVHERLANYPKVIRSEVCGSLRRRRETVGDVDIVASVETDDREDVMEFFRSDFQVHEILASGPSKTMVRLRSGLQVDLRLVQEEQFAAAVVYFTGSKAHNIHLRNIALDMGLKMNEYGVFRGEEGLPAPTEEDVYKLLGLAYVEPELREDTGEVQAAARGRLPKLVTPEDLRGAFHVHTVASDGVNTLEEMVDHARKMGLAYVGISDHSKAASYAHGLKEDRLLEHLAAMDALNASRPGIHIFKGSECDILADGRLDYDDDILARFDFVVASIHSGFKMPSAEMTARICKAIENPYTTILGHPTGRLLLSREPYAVDVDEVLKCAAKHGVVIEINAHPSRLDLDWRYCMRARELGLKFAIDPDAHSCEGLEVMPIGVGIARKGWLEAGDVINTMPLAQIQDFLAGRRQRAKAAR